MKQANACAMAFISDYLITFLMNITTILIMFGFNLGFNRKNVIKKIVVKNKESVIA